MISRDIQAACDLLRSGRAIGMPTETVYGLAADALHPQGVSEVYRIKKRPSFNPLILHVASLAHARSHASVFYPQAEALAKVFWPGPLTLVLPKKAHIPDQITAGKSTFAVRVPNHPVALALLEAYHNPIVAPSANLFGTLSPTSASHVVRNLGSQVPLVLDGGDCRLGIESTIVGFTPEGIPEVFRLGSITLDQLKEVCPDILFRPGTHKEVLAPGMYPKHYAPKTPLLVVDRWEEVRQLSKNYGRIALVAQGPMHVFESIPAEVFYWSDDLSLEAVAHDFYRVLDKLDEQNFDLIVTTWFNDHGLGSALNDKLKRASYT
ncbi:MAG: L-threonylcarbamoyladenylate synthase [Flavobacteriaceae bacterium]